MLEKTKQNKNKSTGDRKGLNKNKKQMRNDFSNSSFCACEKQKQTPPSELSNCNPSIPRLDWNLLSTATPAINAWMNPSDRLMTSVRQLVRVLSMRTCSVIACMMTEALDVQGIHVSYKVSYRLPVWWFVWGKFFEAARHAADLF